MNGDGEGDFNLFYFIPKTGRENDEVVFQSNGFDYY